MEEKKVFFKSLRRAVYFLSFFASFFVFTNSTANAASLYFSPTSGKYGVGVNITVSVYVSTQDTAINNAEAVIHFPTEYLSAVSASQANSIFSIWVQPVTISNGEGTISFNGGLPTPGYTGKSGRILTAVFKAKKAGTASLNFSSASVRANDGKGTDVLTGLGSAQFTLGEVIPVEEPPVETKPEPVISNTPAAPVIRSETHPDPTSWYSKNDVKLSWPVPSGITGTRVLLGKLPDSTPTVVYTSPISSKDIDDLEDGIWYFHVQLRNANGWGQITHFPIRVDTQRPTLEITEITRDDLTAPKVKFTLLSSDIPSGVDYYELQIDNLPPSTWRDDGSHTYETPALDPGRHVLLVKVLDKAGNSTADSVTFRVATIDAPVITDTPEDPTAGQILYVKGSTYPGAQVEIWVQKGKDDPKKMIVQSDEHGLFSTFFEDKLESGIYSIWANATLKDARSNPSEKITIAVREPIFLRIGTWLISFLSVVIVLIALIVLLLLLLWYVWHKYKQFKAMIKKEVEVAEKTLHIAFDELREGTRKQISTLEKVKLKRELTKEETRLLVQLKNQLNAAEKYISQEMQKIEKDVQ